MFFIKPPKINIQNLSMCILWDKKSKTFSYPENKYIQFLNKKDLGIAIEGGGIRSYIFSLGFLRGLYRIGVFENVKYISSVSGSSWISIPLCYTNNYSLDTLFGSYYNPEKITIDDLEHIDENSLLSNLSGFNYMTYIKVFINALCSLFNCFSNTLDFWSKNIGNIILKKYDLNNTNTLPSINGNTNTTNINNNNIDISYIPLRNDVPYLIVNGTTLINKKTVEQVEFTPLYYRINGYNLVEPHGFCNFSNSIEDSPLETKSTIMKIYSTSSAEYTNKIIPIIEFFGITSNVYLYVYNLFKCFKLPSITTNDRTHKNSVEFLFGDGSFIDNTGIISLLKRDVKNIISIINIPTPNTDYLIMKNKTNVLSYLYNLFHPNIITSLHGIKIPSIQVFESFNWDILIDQCETLKKTNKPIIVQMELKVLKNEYYEIMGGYNVNILFIISNTSDGWLDNVNIDVKDYIKKNVLLSNDTYNMTKFIYSNKLANTLSQMATYDIVSSKNNIISSFISKIYDSKNKEKDDIDNKSLNKNKQTYDYPQNSVYKYTYFKNELYDIAGETNI